MLKVFQNTDKNVYLSEGLVCVSQPLSLLFLLHQELLSLSLTFTTITIVNLKPLVLLTIQGQLIT